MDAHLKLLADASLEVAAAEAALEEAAFTSARDRLDAAALALGELRSGWPGMSAAERALVGPPAGEVRRRLDAALARVPRVSALSEGEPVDDPEQEVEPALQ